MGLLSGEDGAKSNDCRWLASGSNGDWRPNLENPKHENQISSAMGGGDYVCFSLRRMANLRKVQRLAQSAFWWSAIASRRLKFRAFIMTTGDRRRTCDRENQHVSGAARRRLYQQMAQYRPELIIRLGMILILPSPASLTMTMPSCRTNRRHVDDWL